MTSGAWNKVKPDYLSGPSFIFINKINIIITQLATAKPTPCEILQN